MNRSDYLIDLEHYRRKQFCIGGRGGADQLGAIIRSLLPSQTLQIIAGLQIIWRGEAEAPAPRCLQPCRYLQPKRYLQPNIETQRHRNLEIQRHRNSETKKSRDIEIQRHRNPQIQRPTTPEAQKPRDLKIQRHRSPKTQKPALLKSINLESCWIHNFLFFLIVYYISCLLYSLCN